MVERNLIKEGFLYNTLTSSGTLSGTQTVLLPEMNALIDGDLTSSALTISSGKRIALTADLGARWRLSRLEYYSSETTISNIQFEISDNGMDFSSIPTTIGGSLITGLVPDTTISGAPRYIRLTHNASTNTDVFEWLALSKDTIVDFGSAGNLTQLSIDDSPIGAVSTNSTELPIFNRGNLTATAVAFVDRTFDEAEEELEISDNPITNFVGKNTSQSNQPNVVPFLRGAINGTRVIKQLGYEVDFTQLGSTQGWTTTGFVSPSISGIAFSAISTGSTPSFETSNQKLNVIASDYDEVHASVRVPSVSGLSEGPRLFWQRHDSQTFDSQKSILSQDASVAPFNNQFKNFVFKVRDNSEWRGLIKELRLRIFDASGGAGVLVDFDKIQIKNPEERVGLALATAASGTFPQHNFDDLVSTSSNARIANTGNVILEPCLITNIRISGDFDTSDFVFLAEKQVGFPSASGSLLVKEFSSIPTTAGNMVSNIPVYWLANPNNVVGFSGDSNDIAFRESTNPTMSVVQSGTFTAPPFGSLAGVPWAYSTREFLITYDSIPLRFLATGRYKTPVFDNQFPNALPALIYKSIEPAGTSIDANTGVAFGSVFSRSSDIKPAASGIVPVGTFTGRTFRFNEGNSKVNNLSINVLHPDAPGGGDGVGTVSAAFYNSTSDEIWALNNWITNTATEIDPAKAGPVFDVFDYETGNFKKQVRATSTAFSMLGNQEDPRLQALALVPGRDGFEDVVHVFGKGLSQNPTPGAFFSGSAGYFGLAMTISGVPIQTTFRRTEYESSVFVFEALGTPLRSSTSDGSYFYFCGTETIQPVLIDDNGFPDLVSENTQISSLPGLGFLSGRAINAITFCPVDGLIYVFTVKTSDNDPTSTSVGDFDLRWNALRFDFTSLTDFTISVVSSGTFQMPVRNGYRYTNGDAVNEVNDVVNYVKDVFFIPNRNTFGVLTLEVSNIKGDPMRGNAVSFFSEIAGPGFTESWQVGQVPIKTDPVWGTSSGTLGFVEVQKDSLLFPNGRYSQIEYVLNSDPSRTTSPYLISSLITQGVRISDIPPNASKSMYVRTNVPDNSSLETRVGKIKVYWETNE